MAKDSKRHLGLWIDKTEFEQLKKKCKEYNEEYGLEMSVNRFILMILRTRD